MVISSPLPTMSKPPQNMSETSIFFYLPSTDWLLGATINNHGHSVTDLQWLFAPLHQQWVKHLKICQRHQIPCYNPLNNWLLGQQLVTIGNGSSMVISSPIPTINKAPQNMSETSNSLYITHILTGWLGQQLVTMGTQLLILNGYKVLSMNNK